MAFSSAALPGPTPAGALPAQLRLFRQVLLALVVLAAVLVAVAGSAQAPSSTGARPVSATVDAPAGAPHALP